MMTKVINLGEITNGQMMGDIVISAEGWSTRNSWGHKASITDCGEVVATAKVRYYNRTWESYRFQSVLAEVAYNYVKSITGIDPIRNIGKRDSKPMKSADAENRRLERLEYRKFAVSLYHNITAICGGCKPSECEGKFKAVA